MDNHDTQACANPYCGLCKPQEKAFGQHPSDCICASCAPVSQPARSPSINPTKPIGSDLEVAQASALLESLGAYERRAARAFLQSLVKVQGARGC